jgi:DNA repair exonuclease SbcCD ATPase subunit
MAEAKEYKQRVEEMENSLPCRINLHERANSSDDQSQVIRQLEDNLTQCENKIKKYIQRNELLEKDMKRVIEAISSCVVADDVGGDSVVDMVGALCEKLTSIEDECAALSNSERKATEYLIELDALREKYSSLEKQLKCNEYDGTKSAATLSELKANLGKAQEKIANLMKENESLKSIAENARRNISELQSERRRQMHYLENENLQLGDDLKRARKELAEAKSAVEAFHKDASNEATLELRGLSNLFGGSASKLAPVESVSKRVPFQSTSKSIPLSSSRKRCPDSPGSEEDDNITEKENLLNKKQRILSSSKSSPIGSEKKKRIANPFSSVKKAARKTRIALMDNTPTKQYALGDSEQTADVTGECNQS